MPITINGNGTVTGLAVGGLPDGAVDHDSLATTVQPIYVSHALLQDQKNHDVSGGGTATAGSWETRVLNTEVSDPDGIVLGFNNISTSTAKANGTNWSVTSTANHFVLGAGTYLIKWSGQGYMVQRFQTDLYNNTDSSVVGAGSCHYSNSSAGFGVHSLGAAKITISGNKEFRIRNRVEATKATYGMGVEAGFDSDHKNVYAQVEIWKEAS